MGVRGFDYYWYRPGENTVAHKYTYTKTVQYGDETYVIGAGYFWRGWSDRVKIPGPEQYVKVVL
jgi:hypothetical protein